MGCTSSKNTLETVDDSVHVMLKHDKKAAQKAGKTVTGYVPRAEHPLLASQNNHNNNNEKDDNNNDGAEEKRDAGETVAPPSNSEAVDHETPPKTSGSIAETSTAGASDVTQPVKNG